MPMHYEKHLWKENAQSEESEEVSRSTFAFRAYWYVLAQSDAEAVDTAPIPGFDLDKVSEPLDSRTSLLFKNPTFLHDIARLHFREMQPTIPLPGCGQLPSAQGMTLTQNISLYSPESCYPHVRFSHLMSRFGCQLLLRIAASWLALK